MTKSLGSLRVVADPDGKMFVVTDGNFPLLVAEGTTFAENPSAILNRLVNVYNMARMLTQISTTADGGIVVGPQGWDMLKAALDITE